MQPILLHVSSETILSVLNGASSQASRHGITVLSLFTPVPQDLPYIKLCSVACVQNIGSAGMQSATRIDGYPGVATLPLHSPDSEETLAGTALPKNRWSGQPNLSLQGREQEQGHTQKFTSSSLRTQLLPHTAPENRPEKEASSRWVLLGQSRQTGSLLKPQGGHEKRRLSQGDHWPRFPSFTWVCPWRGHWESSFSPPLDNPLLVCSTEG